MLFGCIHLPDFPVQASLWAETYCFPLSRPSRQMQDRSAFGHSGSKEREGERAGGIAPRLFAKAKRIGDPAENADQRPATRTGVISFRENAVAVLDGPDSLLKVFACNAAARHAGIEIGMTKIQAEACPDVVLRRRELEQETSAQLALLDCGYRYSPRLESTSPGTIIIDLTGAERLLGKPQEIARELAAEAEACGFSVNVALAANPDTALHAARGFSGIRAVPAGKEASTLAPLPVEVLQPEEEILDIFESWGIRDFQSLARLPSVPLTQRLGQHGLHLQRLARGEVQRELIPAEPPAAFTESAELEEAIELLEPLAFVLNRLLEELCTRLRASSLATDHLRADLELEIHSDRQLKQDETQSSPTDIHQRTLKLPVPTQDAKVLLKLLQLDLEANPPQAPVKKVKVEVFPARLRLTQAGLFQPLAPEPAKLEITLARLRATVGEADDWGRGRVGFPVVNDSHRPDDFQVLPSSYETKEDRKIPNAPKLVLHVFRPPLAARVEVNSDDSPHIVLFRGAKAKVMHASGPWRSSGAWWDKAGQWHRDEWDVDLKIKEAQGVYRIFRDFQTGQWFVEGMYD